MKGGNGENGINVAMELLWLGPPSKTLLQNALNRNLLFWVVLLSSDRLAQWMDMLQTLEP